MALGDPRGHDESNNGQLHARQTLSASPNFHRAPNAQSGVISRELMERGIDLAVEGSENYGWVTR